MDITKNSAAPRSMARAFFKDVGVKLLQHRLIVAWSMVLLLVNLPLVWGDVRSELLYLPHTANAGQWWRALTFPLVHLSWYHLLLDAGGFLAVYVSLETRSHLKKALYIFGAGCGTLLLACVADPHISQRGLSGLSGIAHGLMAVSALEMLECKSHRGWGQFMLLIVILKSVYELWSGRVLFDFIHMGMCGQPLAASHTGGVIGGILVYLFARRPAKAQSDPDFLHMKGRS